MNLTQPQAEGLEELINIAFSRSAAALSELTDNRILIEAPRVAVCSIGDLPGALGQTMPTEIISVHQLFTGPVSGDAFFIFDKAMAAKLAALMTGHAGPARAESSAMDAAASEVLTEVGNILLNACLGVFGNLLEVQVTFSVPKLHMDNLKDLLSSIHVGKSELQYALIATTSFRIKESSLSGYLVIALGVTSLDQLLAAAVH